MINILKGILAPARLVQSSCASAPRNTHEAGISSFVHKSKIIWELSLLTRLSEFSHRSFHQFFIRMTQKSYIRIWDYQTSWKNVLKCGKVFEPRWTQHMNCIHFPWTKSAFLEYEKQSFMSQQYSDDVKRTGNKRWR